MVLERLRVRFAGLEVVLECWRGFEVFFWTFRSLRRFSETRIKKKSTHQKTQRLFWGGRVYIKHHTTDLLYQILQTKFGGAGKSGLLRTAMF